MINLKDVTLVSIDTCGDYKSMNNIRMATISRIVPFLIQNIDFGDFLFVNPFNKNSHLISQDVDSYGHFPWYNDFCIKELPYLIKTKFYMIIQWDGFPLYFNAWNDSFLEYDYIGGGHTLQNGGFSLRKTDVMIRIAESKDVINIANEDGIISSYMDFEKYDGKTSFKIKHMDEYNSNKFSYFKPYLNRNYESFGWHRSEYISENEIYNIFLKHGLFSNDELDLLTKYCMIKSINSIYDKVLSENYMDLFKMDYNHKFFRL